MGTTQKKIKIFNIHRDGLGRRKDTLYEKRTKRESLGRI